MCASSLGEGAGRWFLQGQGQKYGLTLTGLCGGMVAVNCSFTIESETEMAKVAITFNYESDVAGIANALFRDGMQHEQQGNYPTAVHRYEMSAKLWAHVPGDGAERLVGRALDRASAAQSMWKAQQTNGRSKFPVLAG